MIMFVALALAIASVPLCGGSLSQATRLRLRQTWLIFAAFVVQTVGIIAFADASDAVTKPIHLASYVIAAAFVVVNHHVPGMKILALGGGLNFAAIVANGGVMPASAWATRVAGIDPTTTEFANSEVVSSPRLLVLGDIFAVPDRIPLANVFSIGDVLLVVGAGYGLHVVCGSRLARRERRPAAV